MFISVEESNVGHVITIASNWNFGLRFIVDHAGVYQNQRKLSQCLWLIDSKGF